MNDLMTEAYREACAHAPSDVVDLLTMELNHADLEAPLRFVDDHADLEAKIETGETVTYTRFAFEAVEPEVNVAGQPELSITIDGASAEIAQLLDGLSGSPDPVSVVMRAYRSDELDAPGRRLLPGEIRHISINTTQVTLRIGFGEIANLPFPRELYTPRRFPGLTR
ncbi:MAG: DUF1833 family protein [Dechloromonas sp.]|nr:DUF1833 family protein [Dechloromonas sp.]